MRNGSTRPLEIIEGEVRHTRMLPKHHGFSVAAFCLRLQINAPNLMDESSRFGNWFGLNKKAVFSVRAADYGTAAHDGEFASAVKQVKDLITSAKLTVPEGDIFLHTFPRILGYVFNPVSFWYFHNKDGSLGCMVCEVNNTFGERHFYVLDGKTSGLIKQGEELTARKEFHVSPFFAVEGRYRFRFMITDHRSVARIDLDNDEGHALSTSISGERKEPTQALWKSLLWRYRWFTVGVIVKIHWEALKLFSKGIRFFSKPTPPQHIATPSNH